MAESKKQRRHGFPVEIIDAANGRVDRRLTISTVNVNDAPWSERRLSYFYKVHRDHQHANRDRRTRLSVSSIVRLSSDVYGAKKLDTVG